jgi:hypothetical protein
MEDDLSGKQVEDDFIRRQPQVMKTSGDDNLSGRRPQWKTISVKDDLSWKQLYYFGISKTCFVTFLGLLYQTLKQF